MDPMRHTDVYDPPAPDPPPAPSEYLDLEDLVCGECGFIHEPGDREACIPVAGDELLAGQDEYEL